MLDFSLTEEQKTLKETVRKFAEKEIRPIAKEVDKEPDPKTSFQRELVKKANKLGFGKVLIPTKYGGYRSNLLDYSHLSGKEVKEIKKILEERYKRLRAFNILK